MANKRTTKPTRPDDARAHRSINALRKALLELIEEKPLAEISIREITDTAGVSYPTFFRRFSSKEALLEDIATKEVQHLLSLGNKSTLAVRTPQSGEAICKYVQEHRQRWKTLLTGGAASSMREEFIRVAEEISRDTPRANPWLPIDLAVPFSTNCIFEILTWWLRQPDDYPLKNVVKLMDILVVDPLTRPRDITLDLACD